VDLLSAHGEAPRDDDTAVVLVDGEGHPVGIAGKREAHVPPGRLHLAFSVFLLDEAGRLILQQRASGKYHSAGLWSNSCCGHPAPGEAPRLAASRRVWEELGLRLDGEQLTSPGTVTYEVMDPVSGMVEWEFNHVFVGRAAGATAPDPAEVGDVKLVALSALDSELAALDTTAWLRIVLALAVPALRRMAGLDDPTNG
jgi:isopentenyl-diphosphate Delta-isomerase